MGRAASRIIRVLKEPQIQVNLYSKVDAALSYCHTDTLEMVLLICLRVADDNVFASPAYQFVDTHVLEMSSVAQHHISTGIVGRTQKLVQQLE